MCVGGRGGRVRVCVGVSMCMCVEEDNSINMSIPISKERLLTFW